MQDKGHHLLNVSQKNFQNLAKQKKRTVKELLSFNIIGNITSQIWASHIITCTCTSAALSAYQTKAKHFLVNFASVDFNVASDHGNNVAYKLIVYQRIAKVAIPEKVWNRLFGIRLVNALAKKVRTLVQ